MDRALFRKLAAEMGVTEQRVMAIQAAPSFEESKVRLAALKADAKATYKKLAFQYHPDRNPGDASAGPPTYSRGDDPRRRGPACRRVSAQTRRSG